MQYRPIKLATLTLVLAVLATPAAAQAVGGRVGVSTEPEQFYFGAHGETTPLVDRVHFRPNIEVGIGDDRTLVALNFEFIYRFPSQQLWALYAGGGPALNIVNNERNTDAGGGFNIVLGVQHRGGLFTEIKVGALDSPGFKFGVGYVFR